METHLPAISFILLCVLGQPTLHAQQNRPDTRKAPHMAKPPPTVVSGAEPIRPAALRCEQLTNPAGIDETDPVLSWRLETRERGQKQTAYHVLVASSRDQLDQGVGDLWDSGLVASDESVHVVYAGKPLTSRTTCHWKVRVAGQAGEASPWSESARWTMGLLKPEDWTAQWIGAPDAPVSETLNLSGKAASGKPEPLFRKEFELAAAPDSAWVTVHSPGYFELYINGAKVGKDVLTPAVSNLDLQSFYVTYDVRRHLRPGRNCFGLWLGEGWADGIAVRAQLDAVVAGQPVSIGTDTSWKTHKSGLSRIGGRKWNDFGGERLDARELVPRWSMPGLDTDSWTEAVAARPPRGPVRSQPCPLNRIGKEIPAVAVTTVDGGRYEIDFGTALTGWLRLNMPALQPGATVTMTFADVRRGKKYQDFKQVSEFVSAGRAGEVFENKFNYAGFRYVVIDGLPSAPAKEDATALLVESDLEEVGSFVCSNELFNRIHRVNQWTQRCLDLGGYYVDCPHRERMGYGDGQVAAEGFMTSFRADGYYRKWLRDWRLRQKPDGNLPHMAPFGRGGGGPGWGGFLSAVTWRHYLYYGDRRVLEENYDAVHQRYVIDEQAYYVMPLMTGVVPESERENVLQNLERNILVKNDGHLDTGMLGTYFMMEYLRDIGRNDLVYMMFNQTSYPGWGHMLAEGATTLWEQWNGHWSRIHSCFTSPSNWLYQGPAGIRPDPVAPGFKRVIIEPALVGNLTWVNAHHDSPYGRIVSNWKREDNHVTMQVTIPANSSATVHVPAGAAGDVTANGQAVTKADHVTFVSMDGNRVVFRVDSGSYEFSSKISPPSE